MSTYSGKICRLYKGSTEGIDFEFLDCRDFIANYLSAENSVTPPTANPFQGPDLWYIGADYWLTSTGYVSMITIPHSAHLITDQEISEFVNAGASITTKGDFNICFTYDDDTGKLKGIGLCKAQDVFDAMYTLGSYNLASDINNMQIFQVQHEPSIGENSHNGGMVTPVFNCIILIENSQGNWVGIKTYFKYNRSASPSYQCWGYEFENGNSNSLPTAGSAQTGFTNFKLIYNMMSKGDSGGSSTPDETSDVNDIIRLTPMR